MAEGDRVRYVETAGRVFSVRLVSDSETRHRLAIVVESGTLLTVEEYEQISAAFVADQIAKGIDIVGWGGS